MFKQVNGLIFSLAVNNAKHADSRVSDMLSSYTASEYNTMLCFVNSDCSVGYAIKPDGDLINVFNVSSFKGLADDIILSAIRNGATKLDCFEPFLPKLYAGYGFRTYKRENDWNGGENGVQYMALAYCTTQDYSTSEYTDYVAA